MKQFWNERYAENNYVYGKDPNQFLAVNSSKLPKGKVLFAAEGEGRNAVFAAKIGFKVFAFDYSESAQEKALLLANENNAEISYLVADVLSLPYVDQSFDALVLIYAHFPTEIRREAHQKLLSLVKPNGKVLFEGFSKEQLNYTSGGPKDLNMLFSEDEVKEEFFSLNFDFISTELIDLKEGTHHQGIASVVRFIGTKK